MPSLSNKEVKESLKKNEEKFTLKFNTCMILMKYIEYVVKATTTTWKRIYKLYQPSDFIIHVDDKDDEDEEEDVETKDDEIDDVNLDAEEEVHIATGGSLLEIQGIEETDVEKIVVAVMASFPHSLSTTLVQSSSEMDSTELVVDTTTIKSTQPSSEYIHLNITMTKVPNTSSAKQQGPPSSRLTEQ